ncbi:MAG: insulinase family protein [Anaerolinea sp.]|nr:insulinase family protein [Anaerolinea sp.]
MENEITACRLENGLQVQLKELHASPIISSWVWYRVGSRNETPGITGISHWVEHMQFKGTPRFPQGVMDKVISREGGTWNAFTYLDWTTFFETMPAEKIDTALQLEADRMVNSLYDLEEVSSERNVIISEREGNENEPLFQLGEAVQKAAFSVHSYRHEVIGDMNDLHSIQRDDLYRYYQQYYSPSNAVLAIAGDFDAEKMLVKIQAEFGELTASSPPPSFIPSEPTPATQQWVDVNGPGETAFMQVAYHAPQACQADFFPFTVLDSLLTGPSGLNMFGGGGISNKTSRLYQKLVETQLVVGVHGGLSATIDPYLYDITVTIHPERQPEEALLTLDEEIDRVLQSPVTEAEVQRAIKQARALFVYGAENVTNQGFWLGYSEMFASYDWFTRYLEHLSEVTPEDIWQVARKYLTRANRVVGIYHPAKGNQ